MAQHTFSLSAALKQKNRIAGELASLRGILRRDNSRPATKTLRSDLEKVAQDIGRKVDDLIAIKSAICAANVGIYPVLARLEEAKASIAFTNSLPVVEGEISSGGGFGSPETKTVYVAYINQGDVDDAVKVAQAMANECQDKIDAYNATHTITVDLSE